MIRRFDGSWRAWRDFLQRACKSDLACLGIEDAESWSSVENILRQGISSMIYLDIPIYTSTEYILKDQIHTY